MKVAIALKKITTLASAALAVMNRIRTPVWKVLTFGPSDDRISPKRTLCVALEKGSVSIVMGSRLFSKIRIKSSRSYAFQENQYPQPENLGSSVALAVNDLRAAKTDVTLSIPKAWAVVKTADFPSTVKENLSDVLFYELDRLTPFNPEYALYDFQILKDKTGRLTIVLMAAKADLIQQCITALKDRGINVNRVTVNLSAMGTLCRYNEKGADTLFVEIDNDGYEGALFLDGFINGTLTGSFPSRDKRSRVETISREIVSLLESIKTQAKSPQIVFLLKEPSPLLEEQLKLQLNQPVKILNGTGMKLEPSRPQKRIPYAAAGGVLESLWPKAKGFNLLKKGRYEKQRTPFALTIILILAILAMWALYMVAPLQIEKQRREKIDHQIMLRKEDVKKVEALKKEIETIDGEISTIHNFKGNRPLALDIVKELTTILPTTAWLTRVRITETTANIEGYASSATGLIPKLEASKYFKKAEFASPTFRDRRQNADRFIIKMEIEGTKTKAPIKATD